MSKYGPPVLIGTVDYDGDNYRISARKESPGYLGDDFILTVERCSEDVFGEIIWVREHDKAHKAIACYLYKERMEAQKNADA